MDTRATLGGINVYTTQNRGATPEELAERATNRIISIGDASHPLVAEQARAFRGQIQKVVEMYLKDAVRANQVTLANRFREAGHEELIRLLDEG